MPTVQIIVASVREKRVGLAIAKWVEAQAIAHGGFDVELVDLREVALPVFDEPNHPRLGHYTKQHTKRWSETIARGDGFVFVMPEYNHSFSGALKNAIDYLSREWLHKPVAFVSYGGVSAGLRAVTALKPVLAAFEMPMVSASVAIPFVGKRIGEDGAFVSEQGLDDSAQAMFDRLAELLGR